MRNCFKITLYSLSILFANTNCSQDTFNDNEKTVFNSLENEISKLETEIRNLELNEIAQQRFESTIFAINKLANVRTGEIFSIENILSDSRLILFINDNLFEEQVNYLLNILYVYSDIAKPVILTKPMFFRLSKSMQRLDSAKIDLYYLHTDDCICNIPYKGIIFFLLDGKNKMSNVFFPELIPNDVNINYLRSLYMKHFKDVPVVLPISKEIKLFNQNHNDTLFCRSASDYSSVLKICLFSKANKKQDLFFDLRKSDIKKELLSIGRLYNNLTFLDSNLIVISKTDRHDYFNFHQVSNNYSFCVASNLAVELLPKPNQQFTIIE
jgi:hypothetical protein